MTKDELIVTDREILGGTPVFAGTRVPVRALFDCLQHGRSVEEFLDQFPSVRREQAQGLLDVALDAVLSHR